MPRKTKKRSRSDWMQIVAEYEQAAGQETQEAFARRNQLNVGTFRYWLYKAREVAKSEHVRFVELAAAPSARAGGDVEVAKSEPVRFVELAAAPSTRAGGDVEVSLARCTVRFSSGADASWIGEVVAALSMRLEC